MWTYIYQNFKKSQVIYTVSLLSIIHIFLQLFFVTKIIVFSIVILKKYRHYDKALLYTDNY